MFRIQNALPDGLVLCTCLAENAKRSTVYWTVGQQLKGLAMTWASTSQIFSLKTLDRYCVTCDCYNKHTVSKLFQYI